MGLHYPGIVPLKTYVALIKELAHHLGKLLLLPQVRATARREQEKEVAAYLRRMADALEGMHEQFAQKEIPYSHGHQFKHQVIGLRNVLYKIFPDTAEGENVIGPIVATMKTLLAQAEDVDGVWEKSGRELGWFGDRLLKKMQRTVGDLRGFAAALEAGINAT